jgi:glycine/D-amino acid oxidase-like deaminating enzyme
VEAREAAPHLAPDAGVGALVEPDVPTVRTDLLPWDLASRAAAEGVALVERCQLLSASRAGGSWSLTTTRGPTAAPLVVDATAAAEVLVAAGLEHGSIWHRWETLTTAPVQPFLRAQVRLGGVELRQTAQGEVEISGPVAAAPPGATGAWLAAGSTLAAAAVETVPPVAQLRLAARRCRNDLVPVDGLPVVGQVTGPGTGDGLYRLGGFGGDPLALAPGAAEALARHLVEDESMAPLRAFEPGRWRTTGPRARAAATVR